MLPYLISASYEESDGLISKLVLTLDNNGGEWTDRFVIQPGTEMELWGGFMERGLEFIGRGEVVDIEYAFTGEDDTVKLTCYDRGHRMTNQELQLTDPEEKVESVEAEYDGAWSGTVAAFVEQMAEKYDMEVDISERFERIGTTFPSPKGQTDYELLSALANIYGAEFRIEYRPSGFVMDNELVRPTSGGPGGPVLTAVTKRGDWYLVFVDPYDYFRMGTESRPTSKRIFAYKDEALFQPNKATALTTVFFNQNLKDQVTQVTAYVWDPRAKDQSGQPGDWVQITESKLERGESFFIGGRNFLGRGIKDKRIKQDDEGVKIRLEAAGTAVNIIRSPFVDEEAAGQYIKNWFEANQRNFITAEAECVGISLKRGEVHEFDSVRFGVRYSGDYIVSAVSQVLDSNGWMTSFKARKIFNVES